MFWRQSFRILCVAILIIISLHSPLLAVSEYQGGDNGNWFAPGNWTDGVPEPWTDTEVSNGNSVSIASGSADAYLIVVDSGSGVSISGASTTLEASEGTIGHDTTGSLSLSNGANVTFDFLLIGENTGASGTITIDGATLNTIGLRLGYFGTGALTISNAGQLNTDFFDAATVNKTAFSTITVTGSGSKLTAGSFTLTDFGKASLTVAGGGKVETDTLSIAANTRDGSAGEIEATLEVTGAGSEVSVGHSSLIVGTYLTDSDYAFGSVTLADGGTLTVGPGGGGTVTVARQSILKIGNGGTAGDLQAGSLQLEGELVFHHLDDIVFDTSLDGDGTVIKQGSGKVTLTSPGDTFTGAIEVGEGSLLVNADASNSTATVGGAGLLGGTGAVGDLTVAAGGTISPGEGIGTFTAGDTLWDGGGTYLWELSGAIGTPGIEWDLLSIAGELSLASTAGNPFTIEVVSDVVAGFNPTQTYTWIIATASSGIVGFDQDSFLINATGFVPAPDSARFSLGTDGNNLVLTYSAVPEPAEWGVLGVVGMLAIALRRRRRRSL